MSRLDEQSYLGVLDVIARVRDVTDPDDFGAVALGEIARVVPSDVLSYNEVDPSAGRLSYVAEPADFAFPPGSEAVLARHAHEHPLIAHTARTGDGSARRISDVWSVEQWHDSLLYREFFAPMGIEHQMSIGLAVPQPIVVGVAVNRSTSDFSDRDRAVLDLLRPHLAQSWRQAREHGFVRSLLHSATRALAAADVGVIVLSDPPHEVTPGALVELFRHFGRPGARDPLPPRVSRWVAGQDASPDALARPLTSTMDGRRTVLRHLRAADDHPAAILLHTDVAPGAVVPSLVASGLSGREVEVLQAVATGASNAEIGARLNIAGSTVKKHLDRIYAKLGVSGRVAATAVMLDMAGHHAS